jgi:hypothetical protein
MARLSTDLSEQQIKQLNILRAKKSNADRARAEYNRAFHEDCVEQHLTKDFYDICVSLEIEDSINMQKLKDYLQSDNFKDYAYRKIFTRDDDEQEYMDMNLY